MSEGLERIAEIANRIPHMKTADKWDSRYSVLAWRVSKWSKDPKAKVGTVLLNQLGWPIALGYNGFPAGVEDTVERLQDGQLKNDMIVHAEQNALLFSGANARGGTIYVYGKPSMPAMRRAHYPSWCETSCRHSA